MFRVRVANLGNSRLEHSRLAGRVECYVVWGFLAGSTRRTPSSAGLCLRAFSGRLITRVFTETFLPFKERFPPDAVGLRPVYEPLIDCRGLEFRF